MSLPSEFSVAVLLTCFNRRDATLACLSRLFSQKLPSTSRIKVFLVDDGSSDGTGAAVRSHFPAAHVIKGNGNLYWNQGMRLAWQAAAEAGDWDAYLWLNDDTMLLEGALGQMLQTLEQQKQKTGQPGIVVGSCREPWSVEQGARSVERGARSVEQGAGGREHYHAPRPTPHAPCPQPPAPCPLPPAKLTYGGRREKGLIEPKAEAQEILGFNGNLVLVAREAFQKLGNLNPAYCHAYGDIDYGIRARQSGIPIWLAPGYLAECERNGLLPWRDPQVPLAQRWKAFRGAKGISIKDIKALQKTSGRGYWLFTLCTQLGYVLCPNVRNKINAWRYGK